MPDLDFLFYPRSIAIVGTSSQPDTYANRNFLLPLLAFRYPGRLYPVNPKHDEVLGLQCYPSVRDIPGTVDYVICSLPAKSVPQVMRDCAAARVKVAAVFSAGFSETGDDEDARLEREVADIARSGNVRLIGPNCLGVHCPPAGISLAGDIPRDSGRVSFISQSGGNARELILAGAQRQVLLNKLVSYGNAVDLNEADFMEYFAGDAGTEVIAGYIEGLKEPGRFPRALRLAADRKPVVLLKGGLTAAGTGAVQSHTAALAGSREMWDVLCRQAGAIQVEDMGDMLDTLLAFIMLELPRGRRVGMVGIGGGASVQAADDLERAGLLLPPFPTELRQELKEFVPAAGSGLRNPVDVAADVYWDAASFARTAEVVANWDGVDILLVMLNATATLRRGVNTMKAQLDALLDVGRSAGKPMAIVLKSGGIRRAEEMGAEVEGGCLEAGFPVFRSCSHAARSIDRMIAYHQKTEEKS